MPLAIEESETASLIRLGGDLTIASAEELKDVLLKALASAKEMRLMLESATELDVTALQLLYATERDATKSGIQFTLEGSVPDDISASIADAGFEKFPVPMKPR